MNKEKFWELFWYGFFGVVGTGLNILIFYLSYQILNFHYMIANIIAWVFSVFFAFVTNKTFVFMSKSWQFAIWIKECINFIVARVGTCFFDLCFMFVAVSRMHSNVTFSKVLANAFVVILNYVLSKIWIFKNM